LKASTVSTTRVNLTWTDNSSNDTGFSVERCQGAGCSSFSQIGTVGSNATAYQDKSVAGGTTYSYRVRAYNGTSYSSYSNVVSAGTPDE